MTRINRTETGWSNEWVTLLFVLRGGYGLSAIILPSFAPERIASTKSKRREKRKSRPSAIQKDRVAGESRPELAVGPSRSPECGVGDHPTTAVRFAQHDNRMTFATGAKNTAQRTRAYVVRMRIGARKRDQGNVGQLSQFGPTCRIRCGDSGT